MISHSFLEHFMLGLFPAPAIRRAEPMQLCGVSPPPAICWLVSTTISSLWSLSTSTWVMSRSSVVLPAQQNACETNTALLHYAKESHEHTMSLDCCITDKQCPGDMVLQLGKSRSVM